MVETIFSCRTISWYSPAFQNSCPSGVFMQQSNFPPTRKSIWQTGAVKPFGPHHCIMYFGSVHAFQTNSRGASKTLVTTIRSVSLTVPAIETVTWPVNPLSALLEMDRFCADPGTNWTLIGLTAREKSGGGGGGGLELPE